MPLKKAPASTPNAYAALDDVDLDSIVKKEDLDKIVEIQTADKEEMTADLKETRNGLNDLNDKFVNLLNLQESNSETLKGLSTAVTSLARLWEAKTADSGDTWSQPTESPARPFRVVPSSLGPLRLGDRFARDGCTFGHNCHHKV